MLELALEFNKRCILKCPAVRTLDEQKLLVTSLVLKMRALVQCSFNLSIK